jgi:TetR/AcrR family transcriptional repressor of nem operon
MSYAAPPDTRRQILDTARTIMAGKGFSAVGLSEILLAAGVPKGSFYHWFSSKEQFGEALLKRHFEEYLQQVDASLCAPGQSAPERLLACFGQWHATQSSDDPKLRCLVVKLSAEVCDLSEPMRAALELGTTQVLSQLERCLRDGIAAGELTSCPAPREVARQLYQLWLGATLLARIQRSTESLDQALTQTRRWISEQGKSQSGPRLDRP